MGFGVTLDPEEPAIVHFVSGPAPPDITIFSSDPDARPAFKFVPATRFRSIPSAERIDTSLLERPFIELPKATPGSFINGFSRSADLSESGSLCAFLVEPQNPGVKWALSANHVIAFNKRYADLKVSLTGTSLTVSDSRPVIIDPDAANPVDAAIVKCGQINAVDPRIPSLPLSGIVPAASPQSGTTVKKLGNGAPGVTVTGTLSYFAARMDVAQDNNQVLGVNPCEFSNQWLIQGNGGAPFASPGDSGAPVVVQLPSGKLVPLGMLIAGQVPSDNTPAANLLSVATPLQNILSELQLATGMTLTLDPDTVTA